MNALRVVGVISLRVDEKLEEIEARLLRGILTGIVVAAQDDVGRAGVSSGVDLGSADHHLGRDNRFIEQITHADVELAGGRLNPMTEVTPDQLLPLTHPVKRDASLEAATQMWVTHCFVIKLG